MAVLVRMGEPVIESHVFGRRLRAARVLAGYSAERLAEEVSARGVVLSKRTLYAAERGEQYPSVPQLDVIMHVLGVTFAYFDES